MVDTIHICFAADDNYAAYMGIALLSILRNAEKEECFHFYILDNHISDENKQKIESFKAQYPFEISWIPLNERLFDDCDTKRPNWTLTIFGRYLIPKVIEADKVLYLDCDVLVRGSLYPLWKEDLTGYYLAGVPDYNVMMRGQLEKRFGNELNPAEYVNSGVLLINNKKWKEEKLFKILLDYSVQNASILLWPDQDAINFVCRKHKKMLPERWNIMGYFYKEDLFLGYQRFQQIIDERNQVVIRHFQPWKKNALMPHREEYLALMRISPWSGKYPQDDCKLILWFKKICTYLWRHPFCFLLPKFYKRLKYRGYVCLFMDY